MCQQEHAAYLPTLALPKSGHWSKRTASSQPVCEFPFLLNFSAYYVLYDKISQCASFLWDETASGMRVSPPPASAFPEGEPWDEEFAPTRALGWHKTSAHYKCADGFF